MIFLTYYTCSSVCFVSYLAIRYFKKDRIRMIVVMPILNKILLESFFDTEKHAFLNVQKMCSTMICFSLIFKVDCEKKIENNIKLSNTTERISIGRQKITVVGKDDSNIII
jgi:hypothetical protein